MNSSRPVDTTLSPSSAFAPRLYDPSSDDGAQIAIKANPGVELAALEDELVQQLRAVRRVRPGREEDFSVNRMDMLTGILDSIFTNLAMGGWFIAMFAILVGCFSIANIMFVSVRERTKIIGVQKAIGAKNAFILFSPVRGGDPVCVRCFARIVRHPNPGVGRQRHGRGHDLHIAPKRVLLALGVAVTSDWSRA